MTEDEVKSMSDLVDETAESLAISKWLHAVLVQEVKQLRASQLDLEEKLETPGVE